MKNITTAAIQVVLGTYDKVMKHYRYIDYEIWLAFDDSNRNRSKRSSGFNHCE